jgi:hypothetical protein
MANRRAARYVLNRYNNTSSVTDGGQILAEAEGPKYPIFTHSILHNGKLSYRSKFFWLSGS